MLLDLVCNRRVLFVGGKGGVGKTTVSSSLALSQARAGRRVLLVSIDPAHNLGHLWGRQVGDAVVELTENLWAREIDPARATEAHLAAVEATMRRLMPEHLHGEIRKHLDLSRNAPGMHESVILEIVADSVADGLREYDLVVFDTAPSGHTARLMVLPELMSAWTEGLLSRRERSERFGAAAAVMTRDSDASVAESKGERNAEIRHILMWRKTRFAELRGVMSDSELCSFIVVLAAERLPVLESIELEHQLRHSGVSVGALVVNKRSPADAGDFLRSRRQTEEGYLSQLRSALPSIPVQELPLLDEDVVDLGGLERFAHLLG